MIPAPLLHNESARLETLLQCRILDTPPEGVFDDITHLASYICKTPIALISLIDSDRQWFKSKVGLTVAQTPRNLAFCAHAILTSDVFIIPDALADERFADNPLVVSDPHVRFYAGMPLLTPEGYALGTLCVIDYVPRELSPDQIEALRSLGRQTARQLELRRNLTELERTSLERKPLTKKRDRFLSKIGIGFSIALLILGLMGVSSYHNIGSLMKAANVATTRHEILEQLNNTLENLDDVEANLQRSGDQQQFYNAIEEIGQEIEQLEPLTTDNVSQNQRLITAKQAIDRILQLRTLSNQSAEQSEKPVSEPIIDSNSKRALEIAYHELRHIKQDTVEGSQYWSQNLRAIARNSIAQSWGGIALSFVILLILFNLIYREIAKRQHIEATLEQERDFIAAVLDTVGALVMVLDPQGKIVRFNRNCEQTTGYAYEEVRNRHFWNFFLSPEEAQTVAAKFADLQSDKFPNAYENYWITKNGERRLIAWSNTVLFNSKSSAEYIIATGIDITQRRQAEEELQQQNTALDEARKQAEEATQIKSAFLATMSHEIRTPMNAVLGMTSLLLETNLDQCQRDFVETIRVSGDNLLTLINDILDFSKLEADEMELEALEFDVATCAEDVADLFAANACAKGLEIVTLIHPDVPAWLRGDTSRLRQILNNLVGNAIKFTDTGEVVIVIALEKETTTTATLRFSVIDTGIGIAPEVQQKLFQPFTQVDASTTRKYGGTGLGLAICKQLVDLMGGAIGVDSRPNQGSTFWFVLSFEKQGYAESTVGRSQISMLHGLKLLVIGATEANYKSISYQTASWGIQVDTAMNADAALQKLQYCCYDWVILDAKMPEVSRQLLRYQIKSSSKLATISLILMASLNQQTSASHSSESIAFLSLIKPVRRDRLFNCLTTALNKPAKSTLKKATDGIFNQRALRHRSELSKLRILIAEDSLVNQKVALNQLKNLGYTADVVANGQEALDLITKVHYDLILMDCQMPVLDGYSATQAIRSLQGQSKHTIIIAMTANALKGDRAKCLEIGMDDYLSKPIHQEDLAKKLTQWEHIIASQENINISKETKQISKNESCQSLEKANSFIAEPDSVAFKDTSVPLIDWQYLNQFTRGDQTLELELLRIFVATLSTHLDKLKAEIAQKNFDEIEKEAHYIKGSSASMGIARIQKAAAIIEQQAHSQRLENIEHLLTEIETTFSAVQVLLISLNN